MASGNCYSNFDSGNSWIIRISDLSIFCFLICCANDLLTKPFENTTSKKLPLKLLKNITIKKAKIFHTRRFNLWKKTIDKMNLNNFLQCMIQLETLLKIKMMFKFSNLRRAHGNLNKWRFLHHL